MKYISEKELRKLESNVLSGNIKLCAIKTPGFGPVRKDFIRDLSDFTGAEIINIQPGKQYSPSCLGKLKSCIITKNNSLLIKHEDINVDEIVENLTELSKNKELTNYDKEIINKRIENLTANTASSYLSLRSFISISEPPPTLIIEALAVKFSIRLLIISLSESITLFSFTFDSDNSFYKVYSCNCPLFERYPNLCVLK